jgi:UDP-3-O-acyl N-acetylglucosamine deacetylase
MTKGGKIAPMKTKANILIVDDEENIIESLDGILTDEGYSVDTTESGDDALGMLQEKPYDLVLLDIWLPGRKDGLQTLREIRKRKLEVDVIMISGHGNIDTAVRATKLGAHNFIEKPLSLDHVLETISTVLKDKGGGKVGKSKMGEFRFIAESKEMKVVYAKLKRAAKTSDPIILVGEEGTGKEFSATYIHQNSKLHNEPFIVVDCANLTESAFNRLFGPVEENPEVKDSIFQKLRGTVYLLNDHLLPPKLKERVISLMAISSDRKRKPLRFIAALQTVQKGKRHRMNPKLKSMLKEDPIKIPPLRERREDIRELINYFVSYAAEDFGKPGIRVSEKAMDRMDSYPWPGNVKELQTVIENSVMTCQADVIDLPDIAFDHSLTRQTASGSKDSDDNVIARKKNTGKGKGKVTRQKTIRKSVVLTGLGLHSGTKTGLIISPLPPGSGIIFGDISSGGQVMATVNHVVTTGYATSIKFGNTSVKTIEHIMATLHMYGITNALLKVNDEVPIMDGSAADFCKLIEHAGIAEQDEIIKPIVIAKKIIIGSEENDGKFISVEPAKKLYVEYNMDYPQPIGKLRSRFTMDGLESYKTEIAPARTFGFVDNIKNFEGEGLGEGGKLNNVILVDDEKIVNTSLRFEDEFARHKVLDILGDMYLLGRPIIGKIIAKKTGHTDNITLLKKIQESLTNDDPPKTSS